MIKNSLKVALAIAFFVNVIPVAFSQPIQKYIDPANMDLNIKPGDDFYRYANGTWIKNNPVPAKETRWGSFNMLRDFCLLYTSRCV